MSDLDTISIMIATDIHLGYQEQDPIRGTDSFNTFKEILKHARDNDVDMVLLGGDLYHENKPSLYTLNESIKLLREFTVGDKKVDFKITSNQLKNFGRRVNYSDPNDNIALPVFSIHGNHDDPTGAKRVGPLDLLSSSGLINYFGKNNKVDDIEVYPITIEKGSTKLNIYGIGNVRDERLHRSFINDQVTWCEPDNIKDYFNLMVIHQNRVPHGPKNYIPENVLPGFLDVVFWGHEHDCRIFPETSSQKKFDVIQPGSPVATSLCNGEAIAKYVGILKIFSKPRNEKRYEIIPILLRTVRQMIIDTIDIRKEHDIIPGDDKALGFRLKSKVNEMIELAQNQWIENNPDSLENPPLPLIRLNVELSREYNRIRTSFFEQEFRGRIANNDSNGQKIVTYHYKEAERSQGQSLIVPLDFGDEEISQKNATYFVIEQLAKKLKEKPSQFFPENGILNAIDLYVNKNDDHAVRDFFDSTRKHMKNHLKDQAIPDNSFPGDSEVKDVIMVEKERLNQEWSTQFDPEQYLDKSRTENNTSFPSFHPKEPEDNDDMDLDGETRSTKPSASSTRGRGSQQVSVDEQDDYVEEIYDLPGSSNVKTRSRTARTRGQESGREIIVIEDDQESEEDEEFDNEFSRSASSAKSAPVIEEEQESEGDDNELTRDASSYSNATTRTRGRGRRQAAAIIKEEQESEGDDNELSRDASSYSNATTRTRRGRGRAASVIEEEQDSEGDDNELTRDASSYSSGTTRARGLDDIRNRGLGNRAAIPKPKEKMELDDEFDDPRAVMPEADYNDHNRGLESIVNRETRAAMKRKVDRLFDSPTPKRINTDTTFSILSQRSTNRNSQSSQRTQSINERDDDDLFD
ncbi:7174_t:CDS:2 [Funneliformis caledonium]|uniref:7174_t:CDS:1 n=1 Tax=Funneliformis caledonium TaxID=1117310 RepID=A0A9N9BDM7_9GLOM|nr:7174_t:CDS:2 [Funneliformis caledonium]